MTHLVSSLKDIVLAPEVRPRVVTDAVSLVESEVSAKGGVSGMAIKAGFAAVNKLKPTLVRDAVDNLLDRFVTQLEPFFTAWDQNGRSGSFETHLSGQKKKVANALLAVTDARAEQVQTGAVKKTYQRLRPMGEKNVESAVPGLGRVLDRYLKS